MINKKSQHEIAGFVMIVVVVAVIGLVMLSLMIGGGDTGKTTSVEVENLLSAVMQKTSQCSGNIGYYNTEELIISCYDNGICLDGRKSCEVLSSELGDVVGKSLKIGSGINKGYKIKIEYVDLGVGGEAGVEIIPFIKKGELDECEVKIGASKSVDIGFGSGVIDVELEVCRG